MVHEKWNLIRNNWYLIMNNWDFIGKNMHSTIKHGDFIIKRRHCSGCGLQNKHGQHATNSFLACDPCYTSRFGTPRIIQVVNTEELQKYPGWWFEPL